jgi:type VI secretion system secreted protein VgrG
MRTTDRDGRVRIQFPWQRGMPPINGGLSGPNIVGVQTTGHAPGDASSGTWVRVAQGVAGPNWGALFTPRAGTEVLVDFVDGDIDRPIIVGQLHNGQHDLPWPAGQDSGANHIGAISGWHLPHLDGGGASQWLVDDSQGQLRMRLATKAVQAKPNVAPGWAKACCSAQQPAPAWAPVCKAPKWTLLKRWPNSKRRSNWARL